MHACRYLFIALLLLFPVEKLWATHYFGMDMYYTHVSGNTYRVTIVSFGDCSGVQFPSFSTTRPRIYIKDDTTMIYDDYLEQEPPKDGVEVTEGCAADLAKSTCIDPAGTVPGVKKFVYSKEFTLPYRSANWKFIYLGQTDGNTIAGRSVSLTNVNPAGVISLEATLDNSQYDNSSPQFGTVATKFYCTNEQVDFNPDAKDADGDGLVYELVPGLWGYTQVTYVAGYSGSNPLAAAAGSFGFGSSTGLLSFVPNQLQKSLVVYRVTEYRNGVKIGTIMREMTFVVLPCVKEPPSGFISAATGASIVNSLTVRTCVGNHQLSFEVNPTDPNGDNITMAGRFLPEDARLEVKDNSTPNPQGRFVWDLPDLQPGDHKVYITYIDDGCPQGERTIEYIIRIAPDTILAEADSAACFARGAIKLTTATDWSPWEFEMHHEGDGILLYKVDGIIGSVWFDSIAPGRYHVSATDHKGCKATAFLDVPTGCNAADIPSAFSPNGDGMNDILYVRGQHVKDMLLRIYNRWGQLVFESTDIKRGWDGKYKGSEAPVEAYGYVLSVVFENNEAFKKQGNITILR